MKPLSRLAAALYRTSQDSSSPAMLSWARLVFFVSLVSALFVMSLPSFTTQALTWNALKPTVRIPRSMWHVVYGRPAHPCDYDAHTSVDCLANPANNRLWKSHFVASDKEHIARIKTAPGMEYWLGVTITPEMQTAAAAKNANFLILGHFIGEYRIWINGEYHLGGSRAETEPISLVLPRKVIEGSRLLSVAVQIYPDPQHIFPDIMTTGIGEGFYRSADENSFKSFNSFRDKVRPFAFFLAYALIGILFAWFWSSATTKHEYLYLALYALISSAHQLRALTLFYKQFSVSTNYMFDLILKTSEATAALFLGLAFARIRPAYFRVGLPLAFFGIASLVLFGDLSSRFVTVGTISTWVQPTFHFVAGFMSLIQAYYLLKEKTRGTYLPVRIRRLVFIGIGFLSLCAVHLYTSRIAVSPTDFAFWHKFIPLAIVSIMGGILLSDYREQGRVSELAPISDYHRLPTLPDRVSGAVLMVRFGTGSVNLSEETVDIIQTHANLSVASKKGTILSKRPLEIIAFFEAGAAATAAKTALDAAVELTKANALACKSHPEVKLSIQASVAVGEVRPIWEDLGNGQREASWEETGSTTPFVEAARLLEFAKSTASAGQWATLILAESTASQVHEYGFRIERAVDKHGTPYEIAVVNLAPTSTKKLRQAA